MIVGDPKLCGRCPHNSSTCQAIDDLYAYCPVCRHLVRLVRRTQIPLKNCLTRELPRPRQDGFNEFEPCEF